MDWTMFVEQIFKLILFPVISVCGVYLIYFLSTKINELKKKTDSDLANKYLDMLNDTISSAVLATTQTYVESLKNQNKFDVDAQKIAFQQTYDAVMKVLTDEAKKYIVSSVGDLETYVTNRIESEVALNKF